VTLIAPAPDELEEGQYIGAGSTIACAGYRAIQGHLGLSWFAETVEHSREVGPVVGVRRLDRQLARSSGRFRTCLCIWSPS
jgi:hypothetical protein